MKVRIIERMDRAGAIEILVTEHRGDKMCVLQHDGTWKDFTRDLPIGEHFSTLMFPWKGADTICQCLLDELIEKGYRPKVPMTRESEMASVKYHLEDMRKLVFKGE